jgi:hypothetical protein
MPERTWEFDRERLVQLKSEFALTWDGLADMAGVNKHWLARARKGWSVTETPAREFADGMGVKLEELATPTMVAVRDPELYPLVGLWPESAQEVGDEVSLQNWEMFQGPIPNNPIAYLWAPATGSTISAQVVRPKTDPALRVEFNNVGGAEPCNVAIHPTGMLARGRKPEQRYLAFTVRTLADENGQGLEDEDSEIPHISVAVRVRDAQLQQWEYGNATSNVYFTTVLPESDSWTDFVVELDCATDALKWRKLLGERRTGEKPDFTVITGVVFEVGRAYPGKRPGDGRGVIEIGKLWLRSAQPEANE